MTDSSQTADRQQAPFRVGPQQYGRARADRLEREAPVDPRSTKWSVFIREHLERKRWTQRQLAEAVAVTGSAVSRWISSDMKPEIASIRAVAIAFDVQVVDAMIAAEAVTEDELRAARVAPDPELLTDE